MEWEMFLSCSVILNFRVKVLMVEIFHFIDYVTFLEAVVNVSVSMMVFSVRLLIDKNYWFL